ncbi:MAG: ThiF family adenylyltransferase [Microcoleaceae cyanobacterium MO_207.B10]|nr:ThiF family adenylyltransferase [Microcoleaceae cyanobacterium MO_207.B10]
MEIEILDPNKNIDSKRIKELFKEPDVEIIDTIELQLQELIENRFVQKSYSNSFMEEQTNLILNKISLENFGLWVYYPWKKMLAHMLPRNLFNELRFVRNKYKITDEEQKELGLKKIGIIGLSVGDAICQTLVQEGIGGEMRIADFDTLSISNLNRIQTSITDIGLPKTLLTKQKLHESNPFLNVKTFPNGITTLNVDDFFLEGGKLDLVIEECDNLEIKFEIRKKAKQLGIPLLMDTSDNEILDIERYDLDKNLPILHGLISDEYFSEANTKELFFKIIPPELVSEEMKESIQDIGKNLKSWPQLASSVRSGAGFTVMAARAILLSRNVSSRRICLKLNSYFI